MFTREGKQLLANLRELESDSALSERLDELKKLETLCLELDRSLEAQRTLSALSPSREPRPGRYSPRCPPY